MSSRDIDLLESGPKPVTPRVVSIKDIAQAAVELIEPSERIEQNFNSTVYFEGCLANGAVGATLFVFDNFETLTNPADVFRWIDTHVRPPNKVLITTRFRDFAGDYPIEIKGMTDEEALCLIDQEAMRLGIESIINRAYKDILITESEGHPYVIKILLGQITKEKRIINPERIVASAENLLVALFERTFESLTPGAKRVFMLLCSWRVYVPAIAVEAVSLRPSNERFDVSSALDELRRFSLIEEVISESDDQVFVGVPLTAASFGRRKLEVSPFKVAIAEDRKYLIGFGAGKRQEANRGVMPRIDILIRSAAIQAASDPKTLDEFIPILEYLASKVRQVYLLLVDLILDVRNDEETLEHSITYLRRFLEAVDVQERYPVWIRLAELCHKSDDVVSEVHALSEAALSPKAKLEDIGVLANRINILIRELKGKNADEVWTPEIRLLIIRVANEMRLHVFELSATDCSRLAWLFLNVKLAESALDVAKAGLMRDPKNEFCLNLVRKLEG